MQKVIGLLALFFFVSCSNGTNKNSGFKCENSALYGYVSICLPEVKGMTECRNNPNVQQIVQPYLTSGPILGYYLNNETFKQVEKLSEITYEDYFMLYGDYQRENYNAVEVDLDFVEKELAQTLFEGDSFDQISSKVEESYGTITAGKPALIEKYSPMPNVRTMIILMKYKNEAGETSVVSAVNFVLVKKRLINLAYYVAYNGGKSIDLIKEKNNQALVKLMEIN